MIKATGSEPEAARTALKSMLDILLDTESTPLQLLEAVQSMNTLFAELGGFDQWELDLIDEETVLSSGTAISPGDAALCLLELKRTALFLRGVNAALAAAQHRFPNETLRLVYAGCGPYATLIMPLLSRLKPEELQVTLLDIHHQALESVSNISTKLGYSDFFANYLQCDACEYLHDEQAPPHIIIAETLQRALDKEPQVALMMNLAPQLVEGGIFIPEVITVNACLADESREFSFVDNEQVDHTGHQRMRHHLAELISLDQQFATAAAGSQEKFSETEVSIPQDLNLDGLSLMLQTHIRVFGEHCLGDYACSLNMPKFLRDLPLLEAGQNIAFCYELGERPGFRYRVLE